MLIEALEGKAGKEPIKDEDLVKYIEKNFQNLDIEMRTAVIMVMKV